LAAALPAHLQQPAGCAALLLVRLQRWSWCVGRSTDTNFKHGSPGKGGSQSQGERRQSQGQASSNIGSLARSCQPTQQQQASWEQGSRLAGRSALVAALVPRAAVVVGFFVALCWQGALCCCCGCCCSCSAGAVAAAPALQVRLLLLRERGARARSPRSARGPGAGLRRARASACGPARGAARGVSSGGSAAGRG
jgi:hypothetical protein